MTTCILINLMIYKYTSHRLGRGGRWEEPRLVERWDGLGTKGLHFRTKIDTSILLEHTTES